MRKWDSSDMPEKIAPSQPSTLADRVRETMRLRNIGVNALGRRMNRKPGYVSALLSQNRSPRARNLTALAQALGVRLAWLVDGDGPRDVDPSGAETNASREDWVRSLDRSDPFPNRRQLKLLDVYRSASTPARRFLDDAHFFPSDRPTVEEWLRELALAGALDRRGRLADITEAHVKAATRPKAEAASESEASKPSPPTAASSPKRRPRAR